MSFHLDFETRSNLDLTKVGAWRYALDPSTQIMCMAVGTAPENVMTVNGLPRNFQYKYNATDAAVHGGWEGAHVSAHNAHFEYAIYNLILHRRFGWPARWDPKLWSCTVARAAQVGLPLGLGKLSDALRFKTPKDFEGHRLMLELCKPTGYDALGDPIYVNTEAKYKRLGEYCHGDVLTEMEADEFLPELVPQEREIWERDLVANRRGIAVDSGLALKAATLAEGITTDLNSRLGKLTGGAIDKFSQVETIKRWLSEQGLTAFNDYYLNKKGERVKRKRSPLDKVRIFKLLDNPDIPQYIKDVVLIRQQGAKTSVAKCAKIAEAVCADGRMRGVLQYHAAHTGRWGGRLLQPHNIPKGFNAVDQKEAIDLLMSGDPGAFLARYGDKSMSALSDMLRGTMIAGPSKILVSADYSAIEARVLFWLAGEVEALASYRRGESPYVEMANLIYKRNDIFKPTDTDKTFWKEYDIGKRSVLGYGFGMGEVTFQTTVYEETAKQGAPVWVEDDVALGAKLAYRGKYKGVVKEWAITEAAAMAAVTNPGVVYQSCHGKVLWTMDKTRRFLVAKLPSGRYLWYYKPEVSLQQTPWKQWKLALCYWGEHPKTKQWTLLKTYGGSLIENLTQAVARDIMANGMKNAEEIPGMDVNLTIHDEEIGETDQPAADEREGVLEKFIDAMCDLPTWAAGCPVKAEGWVGYRYHK